MKVSFVFFVVLLSFGFHAHAQTCNDRVIPSTPDARFSVSGDEVTDLQTSLIWQRCSVGQSWDGTTCSGSATVHNWSEALVMATADWRLPNIKELTSIVEIACYAPAVNLTVFPETESNLYWSSSPYADNSSAWIAPFNNGRDGAVNKLEDHYVRLVRGGQ